MEGSLSLREMRRAPTRKFVGRGGDFSARVRHCRMYGTCGDGMMGYYIFGGVAKREREREGGRREKK
jgi:hypothetical protein